MYKVLLIAICLVLISLLLPVRTSANYCLACEKHDKQFIDTTVPGGIIYPPVTSREGKDIVLPLPPVGHPRLFFTNKDIGTLNSKKTSALLANCWMKINHAASVETDGVLQTGEKNDAVIKVRNAIEAKALLYQLSGDTGDGKKSIAALFNYYATLRFDSAKADVTRDVGRAIVTGAIVYDWCYSLLTAPEKKTLIDKMEALATQMEIKWPALVQGSVTGHGTEAQLSRDMLAFGVATYDEKPIIYRLAAGRIIAEFVPSRKFFYPAAYHHQGSAYGPYRFSWDMVATLIFDKLGYPSIFGSEQAKAPYYFLYSRRPDGQLFRNGDDFNELFIPFGRYWNFGSTSNSYAGSYFKDPILFHEALREGPLGNDADYLFDFLFCDGDFTGATTKTSLPLTKYFPSPFGAMIARTGWEEGLQSSSVVAEMKIGEYNFVNHQHLDAGSFQLYYKGPLTVESGIYQGTNGGYGSPHFTNYSQRTIAHNALLIYDPNEKFNWQRRPIGNDGGQPYPNNGKETDNLGMLLNNGYETAKVIAHAFGPDSMRPAFSYLEGDLTKAYPGKVKSCRRAFVFLNLANANIPAALIVFDKIVAASKDFKKSWLLHSVEEPIINGNQTTVLRHEKGYNGKMINTTLLPESNDLVINKIGGAGNEFSVSGQNFPQALNNSAGASYDSAMWRIEVSPKTNAAENFFLNVMQVMDNQEANAEQVIVPEKIETDILSGVKINDRIVLFNKNEDRIQKTFQLTVSGNQNYKVLITGVQKGDWQIMKAGNKKSALYINNSDQVLYFNANAGNYVISKK